MNARLPHATGSPRLEVANFGPVSKAELDLRPLTVFAGPSNTGKSCIAKLVYALHGYFSRHPVARTRTYRLSDFNRAALRMGDLPTSVRRLEEFVWNTVEERVDSSALGEDVAALTRLALEVTEVGADTSDPLLDVFGTASMDDLILLGARECRFSLSYAAVGASGPAEAFQYAFNIVNEKLDCTVAIPSDASLPLKKGRLFRRIGQTPGLLWGPGKESPVSHTGLLITLLSLAQPGTVGSLSRPAWYLPAGRSGIIEAQAAILGSAIDRMSDNGPRNHGPVPAAVREFLRDIFVDLPRRTVGSQVGESLARLFEQTILSGTVRADAPAKTTSSVVAFRPEGWDRDLPLGQASSLATQMIPLVLYLRHYATPGSTIIIEEPEAHMHPASAGAVHGGSGPDRRGRCPRADHDPQRVDPVRAGQHRACIGAVRPSARGPSLPCGAGEGKRRRLALRARRRRQHDERDSTRFRERHVRRGVSRCLPGAVQRVGDDRQPASGGLRAGKLDSKGSGPSSSLAAATVWRTRARIAGVT